LNSMLQGVLARGTAHAVKHLSPYVGGKTGTTDNWADAWFVGFTNDVTVAIWVGYDNGDGGRRTLGRGQTGAKVALPMFEPIVQAAWELHAPKTALNGPSREAMRQLVALSIDPHTGDPAPAGSGRAFTEYLKRDPSGRIDDTQFRIVSRAESYAYRGGYDEDDGPFQLQDVPAAASVPIAQIKPRTIIFADQRNDKLADSSTGLIPFDDWARSRPVQRRFLSLFPSFVEPTLNQQTKLKLSVYQAEARFRLPRPAAALDLSRYANVAFLEQIDPAVKHRPITAGDTGPNQD